MAPSPYLISELIQMANIPPRLQRRFRSLPSLSTSSFYAALAILLSLCNVGYPQKLKAGTASCPELRKVGHVTQLFVDGRPFLVLGGELGNSTASSLTVLETALDRCQR